MENEHYLNKYLGKWMIVNPASQSNSSRGKLKSIINGEGILNPSVDYIYLDDGENFKTEIVNRDINFDVRGAVIIEQTRKNIENYCRYYDFQSKKESESKI